MTDKEELFEHYKLYLEKWFYKPPFEAVELALTIYCSHTLLSEKPVWSFFLGPSSIGKSAIIFDPLSDLPSVKMIDGLSVNSFQSGWQGGGILNNWDKKDIFIIFSDFSTFLKLKAETREEIQSQLRRYFDMTGPVTRDLGNKKLAWEGKMTVIAGCTPVLEKHWLLGNELGERFLSYKIPYIENIEDQRKRQDYSDKHIGNESKLRNTMKERVKQIIDPDSIFTGSYDLENYPQKREVRDTVILTALLRRSVERNYYSPRRDIVRVAPSEGTPRLSKQAAGIIVGNSMLFRANEILERSVNLAKTCILSTIPAWRYRIFAAIYQQENHTLNVTDLLNITDIPKTSLRETIEDLEEIEVLYTETGMNGKAVTLNEEFISLANDAKFNPSLQITKRFTKPRKKKSLEDDDEESFQSTKVIVKPKGKVVNINWNVDREESL